MIFCDRYFISSTYLQSRWLHAVYMDTCDDFELLPRIYEQPNDLAHITQKHKYCIH
jgi:hypothetical protein